ncbi:MAG: TetR/AcrR family transcriptional regulator [Melioribacter sp.]|nr:TetR/AcrR family transcriptional regulator [Melioribacter sp.]
MKTEEIKYREIISGFIRERILDEGFTRITLDALTAKVGISKKTIYKYYPTKEDLVKSVIREEILRAYNNLIILLQEASPMIIKVEKLSEIIKEHIILFNDNSFEKLKTEYRNIWKDVLLFRKEKVFPLINLLIDHAKKHSLIIDYPNELIIKIFSNSLLLSTEKKYLTQSRENFHALYEMTFEILLKGILTKKGEKLLAINKRMKNENKQNLNNSCTFGNNLRMQQ